MKLYVGITDGDWYEQLALEPDLEEVNFWQPGGSKAFRALQPGELFLFKLHSPHNFIVGGGVFTHWTRLPVSLAWEVFGVSNGAISLPQMRQRIEKYRRQQPDHIEDYAIGCILLEQPFFFPKSTWIPIPPDWKPSIQQGKRYDLEEPLGRRLWDDVQHALAGKLLEQETPPTQEPAARFGDPILIRPRLGQGGFRVLVTDAYQRRCAITRERTLPALEAAHIRPYSKGGEHRVNNGLLIRRDLHALFDRGYITVAPSMHLEVSRRIREEWENGRDYYALHGRQLSVPQTEASRPGAEYLTWHNEQVFLG